MLEKLASLSVGLAGFIGGLWIILLIIRALKDRKANGNGKSAGLTAAEWKNEIRQAAKDALYETAPKRHEELRKLMEEVIEHEFLKRNETLKELLREELRRRR